MNRPVHVLITTAVLLIAAVSTASAQTDAISSVVPPGVLFEALAVNHDLPTRATPKYNSPTAMAVSPDKKTVYIAQQTAKRIDIFDLDAKTVTGFIRLPDEVTGITFAPDGSILYATCSSDAWPAGKVCSINLRTNKVEKTVFTGFGSRAPVVTPDGSMLFVCNRFSNDVSAVDAATFTEQTRIPMVREPYCAAITPDGKTLVVGNLLPADRSTDTAVTAAEVSIVNIAAMTVDKEIRLHVGATAVSGIAISPDGNYALATHIINNFAILGSTPVNGWLTVNEVAVIDLQKREYTNSVSLDYVMQGAANPWSISIASQDLPPDSTFMIITHAGSSQVSIIHYQKFIREVLDATAEGTDMYHKFTYLPEDVRKSITLGSVSPRALAVSGRWLYTAGYFDDNDTRMEQHYITLASKNGQYPDSIIYTLGTPLPKTAQRKGEQNFYNAALCFQMWMSCNSCHVHTRTSGLNRILSSGVAGTPKNTTSMLYSWWTPPTTWTGRRENAYNSVRAGIELELFQMAQDSMSLPLDTFLMHLKPAASPFRENGRLSEAAQHGKELFNSEKSGCFKCHPAPLFTDNLIHDAFVPDSYDQSKINTPSLVEIWRTAPYGHLGLMADVREMMLLPGHNGSAALSAEDFNDLVQYVLSL